MKEISLKDRELIEYYQYVKSLKTLSINELDELLKKNNQVLKKKFIESYLYYVFVYAYHMYNKYSQYINITYSLMDLIQDGNLLLVAMIKEQNVSDKISSFNFYYWLTFKRLFEEKISLKTNRYSLSQRINVIKAKEEFYQNNHREASIDELSEITNLSKGCVINALLESSEVFLDLEDELLNEKQRFYEMEDMVIDSIQQEQDRKIIFKCLECLNERGYTVVSKIYGLNNCEIKSLSEIAKELHVSRQFIHDTKNRCLRKIYNHNKTILDLYRSHRF